VADNARIDDLRKRLEKEPGSRVFAQLAEELRKGGDLGEAIEVCRAGLEKQPAYFSARMTLGRALQESGDLAGARPEFEAVLKASPDNILASRLLGECLEGTGDLQGAANRYRATLTLAPGDKQAQARLDAVEALLKAPAAAASAEPAAPQVAPDAPIPLVAAEESFELESAHESFHSTTVAQAATAGVPERGFPTEPATPPAAAPLSLPSPTASDFDFDPGPPPMAAPEAPPVAVPSAAVAVPEPPSPAAAVVPSPTLAPAPPPAMAEPAPELASSTLAELYFNQGFNDKAIDVYRQLIEREPGNERAHARLTELQALERHLKAEEQRAPAAAPAAQDPRAVRRAAIERTIARLEGMLAAVRRD